MAREESGDLTVSQGTRMLFYLMTPNETSFSDVDGVPRYVQKATPFFVGLVLLEVFVAWLKTGDLLIKINDGTTSLAAGMISRLPHLFVRSLEVSSYIYVWNNFHILELPWDSAWTWWLAFLGVDFGYYWVHRFAHEVNLLWAAHQVHHSSEYYNLTTALRQSVTQQCASWVFYLPMALIVPPSVFAVHIQFNLLYQFWIHTEMLSQMTVLLLTGYILLTLTSLGYIIDQSPNAAVWEMLRCLIMMALYRFGWISPLMSQLAFATEVCQ
uniref:Alkylglycerol monooxygenase n=1 Tax=Astyanax mexicanus TaxID=7994 RepID=A0A8B9K6E6_ASTMX